MGGRGDREREREMTEREREGGKRDCRGLKKAIVVYCRNEERERESE
jgi:hypothetical protein